MQQPESNYLINAYELSLIPSFIDVLRDSNNELKDSDAYKYINATNYTTRNGDKYRILRYNKPMLSLSDIPFYGLLRSVVVNSEGRVVSFAPPKTIPAETFAKLYLGIKPQSQFIAPEEFVEGTMINLFWDNVANDWRIATRSTVEGEVKFFRDAKKTFRDMFYECVTESGLNISSLDTSYCYSFVIQHPENRIVTPFQKPALILIDAYHISHNFEANSVKIYTVQRQCLAKMFAHSSVRLPVSYANLQDDMSSEAWTYTDYIGKLMGLFDNYSCMGVIIRNVCTGERMKLRNPLFEEIKQLRGNQPKLQYQYLFLRNKGMIPNYLQHYPEHKKDFSQFRDQVHTFTTILYQNYVRCYIKKEKPLGEFDHQFKNHMYNIHQLYVNELKPNGSYVTNTVVQNYVNGLHPSQLMYSLNFNMRKRIV